MVDVTFHTFYTLSNCAVKTYDTLLINFLFVTYSLKNNSFKKKVRPTDSAPFIQPLAKKT